MMNQQRAKAFVVKRATKAVPPREFLRSAGVLRQQAPRLLQGDPVQGAKQIMRGLQRLGMEAQNLPETSGIVSKRSIIGLIKNTRESCQAIVEDVRSGDERGQRYAIKDVIRGLDDIVSDTKRLIAR